MALTKVLDYRSRSWTIQSNILQKVPLHWLAKCPYWQIGNVYIVGCLSCLSFSVHYRLLSWCLHVTTNVLGCFDDFVVVFTADVTLEVSFLLAGIFLSMNIIYGRANFPISANFLPFIENVMIWKVSTDFYCIENDVKCNIMLFIHCYNERNLVIILFCKFLSTQKWVRLFVTQGSSCQASLFGDVFPTILHILKRLPKAKRSQSVGQYINMHK